MARMIPAMIQRHHDDDIAFHLFLLPENTLQSDTCSKVNQRHASLMVMLIVVSVPLAIWMGRTRSSSSVSLSRAILRQTSKSPAQSRQSPAGT